jgi:FkbM family methyltransferase
MVPNYETPDGSRLYPETRVELKKTLDSITNPEISISTLQTLTKSGPRRRICIEDDSIIIQLVESGSTYHWNLSDPRTAVACLVAIGEYEPVETKILQILSKDSKLILDVGANVGYYTIELSRLLASDGKLLSFEPVDDSYLELQKNIEINHIKNAVQTFQLGLSDSESEIDIFLPQTSGSSAASLRNLHPEEDYKIQRIKTTTLDQVFGAMEGGHCDLIKIDVEGGELQVIQGGIETIKKFKPIIFAELLRKWSAAFSYSPNDVLEILQNLGYTCWGVSEVLREIEVFDESDTETNFLFVHERETKETMDKLLTAGIQIHNA